MTMLGHGNKTNTASNINSKWHTNAGVLKVVIVVVVVLIMIRVGVVIIITAWSS